MYIYYYKLQNSDEIMPMQGNDYDDAKKIRNALFEKFSKTETDCTVRFVIMISGYVFDEVMEIKNGKLVQI